MLNSFQHLTNYLLVICLLAASCAQKEVTPPPPVLPVPTAQQLAWHSMELNAFIHFSINTFTDKEWGYGDESPAVFNPTDINTDQWVSTLKEAGFKGVILTCKHHDGFCLWPTMYTEHSVKHSPLHDDKRDIVKQVAESCKRYGLKFGLYVSPWDRNRADYGDSTYVDYYRNQLEELFTAYGPVFEMWFDGANGGDGYYGGAREKREIDRSTYYDWPATLQRVSALDSATIFFSDAGPGARWCGNEAGEGGETNWNMLTPDTLFAGKPGTQELLNTGSENGSHWIPAEVNTSIRPGWFYHASEDSLVKSPERLFDIYLSSVGRGSPLLLNVPPDRRGLIHENDVKALLSWKQLRDSIFHDNLAVNAIATSSSHRGESDAYAAANVIDNNGETYWATDDDVLSASVELAFAEPQTVKYVVLQEYIKLGQRVKSFTLEAWTGNNWKQIAQGTTIGYKRIIPVDAVETTKIRVTITDSKACPVLSSIELY